ncbi:ABC-three component system middle component 6 [Plantibacter sp. YIM 135249]|uniref:ABC-three component system middle component 6 n=1 Tax=Plantibacter sp. YIM 135249 TaxID=3423918 RepID=UPI003D3434B8
MSELFPDKFTPIAKTLVGEAATILGLMGVRSLSVGQLFVEFREAVPSSPFDSFAAALTLLYGAGAINHYDGILRAN